MSSSSSAVIDANVCVASVLPDEDASPYAERLLSRLRSWEVRLYAPPVWRYEAMSAIRRAYLLGRVSAEEGSTALSRLVRMPVLSVEFGNEGWLETWRLAVHLGITTYDASYLALARDLGCHCLTTDRKLLNAAADTGLVRWIGDYE